MTKGIPNKNGLISQGNGGLGNGGWSQACFSGSL